ncbi:uncharacterized protein LOC110191669 [Drosophila serrata]|uniref:uncharacterized protein LOC110191669 n=1 Tax=Drosophila serrata TaxID=7274 RepID=UPI000A1D0598|nr:uncharacterized protein LOC110191669 [Drosophila serrata]
MTPSLRCKLLSKIIILCMVYYSSCRTYSRLTESPVRNPAREEKEEAAGDWGLSHRTPAINRRNSTGLSSVGSVRSWHSIAKSKRRQRPQVIRKEKPTHGTNSEYLSLIDN